MENLKEVVADMEEELEMQIENLKEHPNSVKSWLFKENIKSLKKLNNKLRKLKENLKLEVFPKLVKSVGITSKEHLNYSSVLLYIYLYSELIGLSKWQKYEYCVVDEGQDFSPLEYLILGKIVLNGRFCILGDLNQSYQQEGLSTWKEISAVVKEANKANVFELDTNYRSTKPIIELANKILAPYTSDYLPKSINRIGSEIDITQSDTSAEMLDIFAKEMHNDAKDLNKSIGIICFDSETLNLVEKIVNDLAVAKDQIIKLDDTKPINYIPRGIYVTMFENCKGLEFAKVYVLDLNLNKIHNFTEAKKAFVAVTRAMNELHILSVK